MAYAAVTSLMETLSLNFLQLQPPFPLEDLEAQIRDNANENLGLLQQILDAQMREMELDEEASSKRLRLRIKACLPRLYGKQLLLTFRLTELAEVKQKVVSLHQNLGLLQQSLEKSEITYDDARVMKDLEAQIRDASFKAEGRIEMELTAIYVAKGKGDSLVHIAACLLRLHEIFNEAEKQSDYHRNELIRLAKVSLIGRIRRRGLQLVKGSSLHDLVHIVSNFSKNTSKFDDSIRMVGCDRVFEKILDQLLRQQSTEGRQVISVVGMGGIGKTTLAHKVYQHPLVTYHFDKRAWVTVSQEYNVEQMLRCLTGCVIATSRYELHKLNTDQLAERLRKHLKEQRYLIVIDDIWSTTAWDRVQICFPNDNNGSHILLTSRLREVAEYASSGNSPLNMPFLDANESWNLYCKVFGKTEFLLVFEQIGKDIVKKCKGLPLAITIVASLLSKTEEEEEKWKNVAKRVMGDSSDACSRILYLSYNQLPHHLKVCFLYFGIFRKGYEISVKKLIRLWAAEGFLNTMKHMNMEKVAIECLQDLVDRSLVIVSKQSYNGEMKRIRIHDLLRDLCLTEARHENLINSIGAEKPCRWISEISFNNEVMSTDKCFSKSHSLHCGRVNYFFYLYVERRLFSHCKLLRVVDIEGRLLDGNMILNVLANLIHLRYLALNTYKTFEVKLFEHWNMQSFIVSGVGVTFDCFEASRIWNMPLLKNFCIGQIFSLEPPQVIYKNLENISWLVSKLCTKNLFTMIPNLKKLGVDGGYYDNNLDWFYNLVHLGQLETLSIRSWGYIKHIPFSGMPWATSFLPNLKKMSLLESYLPWSELSLISMLPNLEVLKLIEACMGGKWESSDGGFRKLKRLVIESRSLEYWNAVGDHFPILECLEISECNYLKEIPRGFADITTLALIRLSNCRDSLVASAKWIQEEQNNNYGNDTLLVRSENILTKKCAKRFEEEEISDD